MLYKAVVPIAFFSLLLFATVACGQQQGSSNVASKSQPGANTEIASSANLQPETSANAVSPITSTLPARNEEASSQSTEEPDIRDEAVPQVTRKTPNPGAPIPCSVVEYKLMDAKSILGLLCPAIQISAPLRVHLLLAWKDVGDVTHFLGHKLVKIGSSANIRAKEGQSKVQLTYQNEGDEVARKQWFDVRVISVGLEKEGNYR